MGGIMLHDFLMGFGSYNTGFEVAAVDPDTVVLAQLLAGAQSSGGGGVSVNPSYITIGPLTDDKGKTNGGEYTFRMQSEESKGSFIEYNRKWSEISVETSEGMVIFPAYDSGKTPVGLYNVTPRPTNITGKRPGAPTLSNTNNWNIIKTPDGKYLEGIQIHWDYGIKAKASDGCIVSPNAIDIWDMIIHDMAEGNVKMLIVDNK
jgi:hypothetical protein